MQYSINIEDNQTIEHCLQATTALKLTNSIQQNKPDIKGNVLYSFSFIKFKNGQNKFMITFGVESKAGDQEMA